MPLVSTVLNPVWGAFSDRTVLRIGRRLPWVLGGLAGGVLAMLVLSRAESIAVMALGWAMAQAALNAMLAAITATVPDQVPSRQRGAVGGWLAIAQTVGVVAGSGIADATGSIAAGYLTIAGGARPPLPALLPRQSRHRPAPGGPGAVRPPAGFVRSFWISPRQHPDFAWAWITRFLMNLGNALVILYLFYYLRERIDLTDDEAEHGVLLLTAAYGLCTVLTAVVGGIWSDRLGRRKVFVIASGLVAATALLLLAFVTTWVGAFAGAVILGIGFGIYTAVDFAMITAGAALGARTAPRTSASSTSPTRSRRCSPRASPRSCSGSGSATPRSTSSPPRVSVLGSVLVVKIKSLA